MPTGYWQLTDALVRADRRPLDRLLRARGLRLRRRHAAAVRSPRTTPTGASLINTIGPVWDGNEVWLLDAGGATFAAFPGVVRDAVLRLLPRALPDPRRADRARRRLRVPRQARLRALAAVVGSRDLLGSAVPALLWGVAFANIVHGVPIDARASSPARSDAAQPLRALRRAHDPRALHAARRRLPLAQDEGRAARAFAPSGRAALGRGRSARVRLPPLDLPERRLAHAKGIVPGVIPLTALGLAIAVPFLVRRARRPRLHRDGAHDRAGDTHDLPQPLPAGARVLDRQGLSLTIWSTSSTHYTLVVMTIVALALTPVVLLYQGWTYYVFRHRIGRDDLAPLKSPIDLLSGRTDAPSATTGE